MFYTHRLSKFAFSEGRDAKFGILGVPFDSTTSYIPGARFGPRSVREASYNFERYNITLDKNLDTSVYDFGDIQVVHGNFKKTCKRVQSTVSDLIDEGIIPIVLGGEHTISYGILKALDVSDTTILYFDAHMDLRDRFMEEKYSHATVMRRIFELNPKKIIQIGVRSCAYDEISFANRNEITYYTPSDVNKDIGMVKKVIRDLENPVYVTVDIDVLDPAYAPAVGNPTPCGLDPLQLERLIHSLANKDVIGFDLVEVASTQIGDITSINGAKVIYDFLCLQENP